METDRRQQILTAAAGLFSRQGYHSTTVADIARVAEMAQGTVYLYFDSKKSVFAALVDETLDLFREVQLYGTRMRNLLTFQQLEEGLPRMYRHVLGLFATNKILARLMLTEVRGADPEIEAKLATFYEQVVDETAENLKIGVEKGFFRPDINPHLVAECLIGIMERFAALILSEKQPDLDAMAVELARFELSGIRHPLASEDVHQDVRTS